MDKNEIRALQPKEIRKLIRKGEYHGTSEGCADGYAQANLAIVPKENAFDFLLFCQRNPKPCPILEVVEPGEYLLKDIAPGADIRTDIARYRLFEKGKYIKDATQVVDIWRDDLVAFLIGCSYSFEWALLQAGVALKHIDLGEVVSVYFTNQLCKPAGIFNGPMVTSMRPIKRSQLVRTVQICSRFPSVHGAPVHVGDPAKIGVDLNKPDFGWSPVIQEDEIPVFWGCGVTPQAVAMASEIDFMITHYPGHMFITDMLSEEFSVI